MDGYYAYYFLEGPNLTQDPQISCKIKTSMSDFGCFHNSILLILSNSALIAKERRRKQT